MSKKSIAKSIRVITVPPFLVTTLLLLLYFLRPAFFYHIGQLFAAIGFLAVLPTLAYPLSALIPALRKKGRDGQRKLAFITSGIGYVGGVIYCLLDRTTPQLKFIFFTYLCSVFILIFFNKVLKLHASGHACGIVGPLVIAVYFLGWYWLFPTALLAAGVAWSSLYLARHTKRDLAMGTLTAIASFCLCLCVILL